MAIDDDVLDSADGLNEAERAEFAAMQEATTGAVGTPDPAGGADAGAGAGAAVDAGADAGGAAAAVEGADPAAAAAAAAAGKDGPAADAGPADDDDDEGADQPVLDAAGKPVVGADGKPERRKPKRVSFSRYTTEKTRADKLAADLAAREQDMARLDERMRLINEALTTPRVDPNARQAGEEEQLPPDPEQDAFGYMKWSEAKLAKLEKTISDMQQGKQTEEGQRIVADAYTTDAQAFVQKEPNFVPAYNHLMNSRMQELAMYFYGIDLSDRAQAPRLTPKNLQHIKSVAAEEERGIVENAIAQNRSPAQAVYQMARFRGFVPRTAEEMAAARAANGGAAVAAAGANGGKPAAATAKPNGKAAENGGQAGSVADEIERIKAGSEAALSLSDGGASPANPLTPQKLANMPQAEFEALMDRLDGVDPDAFRRLVEGTA